MPGPILMAVRLQILRQYEEETPISAISRNFKVSRRAVHTLIKRYQAEGEQGLKPLYSNCGKKRLDGNDFVYRAVRCMKSWHPGWGAEKIHAEISRMRFRFGLAPYSYFVSVVSVERANSSLYQVAKSAPPMG